MKFKDENKTKQLVVEIMSSEYVDVVSGKGLVFNESIIYDKDFSHITNDGEYSLIEEKIKSIVNLINNNPTLVHKDLEDELWYMV
jgi:translation initiation factor 6 (eIF-6)